MHAVVLARVVTSARDERRATSRGSRFWVLHPEPSTCQGRAPRRRRGPEVLSPLKVEHLGSPRSTHSTFSFKVSAAYPPTAQCFMRNVDPLPRHVTWRFRRFTRPSATKLLPRLLGSTGHSRLPNAAQRPPARSPTRASPPRRCTSSRSSSSGSVTTTRDPLGARRRERRPPRTCTPPRNDPSGTVTTT